jgi:hypothetical protein
LIGDKLIALGLEDATDKVAALAKAYEALKARGTLFPYEPPAVAATAPAVVSAAAPAPVAAPVVAAAPPVAPKVAATSSSLFGRSSGTNAPPVTDATAPQVEVPRDATPAEIIDAWKKAQVAAGQDPNKAFQDTFSARKA